MFTRRDFLIMLAASASGLALGSCKKTYIRPPGEFYLGKVQDLLDPMIDLPNKAFIVFFDEQGWSVMSTRCTVEGCTCSNNVDKLICSCCRSVYTLRGEVVEHPAEIALPWYEIKLADGALYAEVGKNVGSSYRFTHPDLEAVMKHARELLEAAKIHEPATIPDVLKGQSDHEIGKMFIENQPEDYFQTMKQQEMQLLRQQPRQPATSNSGK